MKAFILRISGSHSDIHILHDMRHSLTLRAYEMNGAPVAMLHGAPLRLLGTRDLVTWIAAIEFMHDFVDLGAGEGGYNKDNEFCDCRIPI